MADDTGGVRDGRSGFCYQTHAALDAIRASVGRPRTSTAIAVYVSFTEAANLCGGAAARGGFEATRGEIAHGAGVSRDTLDWYVPRLIECGVLGVEKQQVGNAKLPNRWVLLDPSRAGSATPADAVTPGRAGAAYRARGSEGRTKTDLEKRTPTAPELVCAAWTANAPPLIEHRESFLKARETATAIESAVKIYPVEDVVKAIENHAAALASPAHYWSHRWTLVEFLKRGLARFVDEAQPLENFRHRVGSPDRVDPGAILQRAAEARRLELESQ